MAKILIGNIKGPKGDTGEKGDQGIQGIPGPQGPTGEVDENTPITFSVATQRANIESGDSLAVAFGKLARYCTDLKTHAFADPVNNLTGTNAALPLAAPQGKQLKEEIDAVSTEQLYIPYPEDAPAEGNFNKNFLLVNLANAKSELNQSSYFMKNSSNKDGWSNFPTEEWSRETTSVIGYREVLRRGPQHLMIRITEMWPQPGRIWTNFYNSSTWRGWKSITPVSEE